MMNIVDLFILLFLSWGAWRGFRNGFVFELALAMALVLSIMVGYRFSGLLTDLFAEKFDLTSPWLPWICFFVIVVAVVILVILFARLLTSVLKMTGLNIFNRIAGIFFGIFKWAFLLSVLIYLFQPFDKKYELIPKEQKETSLLYDYVSEVSLLLIPAMEQGWAELEKKINSENVNR